MLLLNLTKRPVAFAKIVFKIFGIALSIFILFLSSCKKENTQTPAYQPPPPVKPNVVLFLADDLGYEIPRSDGGQSYQTPNLDKMAAGGMKFTQCYSSPLCSPSRIMLLTGKYSFRNYFSWGHLGLDQQTIANMMRDAGYYTCLAGKWQVEGGGDTINHFGFDNYCLWNISGDGENGSRYKSPKIYINGAYLPDDSTKDKYADDIFTDYIKNFLHTHSSGDKPFFIYYPLCLTHKPFSPIPSDPDFPSWDPDNPSDTKYFPEMVNYLDKKIGDIISEIKSLSLDKNTIYLFSGDNGTSVDIYSLFNGSLYRGGKGKTTNAGTHVPLIAYCPGYILPSVNDNLVDFTDILPTLAEAAGISRPSSYGVLDGTSFYPQLFKENTTPRNWVFCHYAPHKEDIPVRYIQDQKYKYYETGEFYNLERDPLEHYSISAGNLNPDEKSAEQNFKAVLAQMHN